MTGWINTPGGWKQFTSGGFSVKTAAGDKAVQNAWVNTAAGWKQFYQNLPSAPTGLTATTIGSSPTTVSMDWSNVVGATSYKMYYRVDDTGAYNLYSSPTVSNANWTGSPDTKYGWYVSAVGPSGEGPLSAVSRVATGHVESTIEAGTGYVSSTVNSTNQWRANTWNYNGTAQPYWGWFTNESFRYHGFWEIAPETMWDRVCVTYPALRPYRNQVTSTSFGIFFTRQSGVGDWGFDILVDISLANGISYANPAEPPNQANYTTINVQDQAQGMIGYSMPANWAQAIYQYHASYNGLLIRAYTHTGARQTYGASTAAGIWDLGISWPRIIIGSQQNSYYW
jgi:hypothetical protein